MNAYMHPEALEALAVRERAIEAEADCQLMASLIEAAQAGDADAKLWTPGTHEPWSLQDCVLEDTARDHSDLLAALLRCWSVCLQHSDPGVRLPAQAALATFGRRHVKEFMPEAAAAVEEQWEARRHEV